MIERNFKSSSVFPCNGPWRSAEEIFPLSIVLSGSLSTLPDTSRSATIDPFTPFFPMCMWAIVGSVIPVTFSFHLKVSSETKITALPAAVVWTAGTTLSPINFALYFVSLSLWADIKEIAGTTSIEDKIVALIIRIKMDFLL